MSRSDEHFDDHLDDHLDEMTCLLFLDGQLENDFARKLVAHTEACADCRRLLTALERETRLLHESLGEEDEAVPARLLAPSRAENISWGWVGALGVAVAGVYALWSAVAEPWLDQLRQVGLGESNLLTMLFFGGVFWKGWSDMLNMMEVLSLGTIAMLVVLLLRRNLRRLVSLSVIFCALLLPGLLLPRVTAAAEFHSTNGTYTVPAGTVVHADLVVGGPAVRIDGTVDGDLIAMGQTIRVNGHVTGDVIAWAQDIHIDGKVDGSCICGGKNVWVSGHVDGNVRGGAHHVIIGGEVARNVLAWAGTLEIPSKGKVGGSVLALVADFIFDGRAERDVSAYSGKSELNGYVGGNARLNGGQLMIGPEAEIRGSAAYQGDHAPEVSPQAKLANPLSIEIRSRWEKYRHLHYYRSHLLLMGAALSLGIVLLLVVPGFFGSAVRKGDRLGAAFGYGAVGLVATPILAVVACITLVGIPLGVAALMAYVLTLYSSQIVVGAWLGEKLLGPALGRGARIARLALGLALLRVCFVIPIVSALAWSAVITMGIGAVALTAYERIHSSAAHAATTQA